MNRRTIAYQPALDGVRALAVLAVLAFHGGLGWMSGGYLGVSVFFTLSGYLITSLLLVEHSADGHIDAAAFYTRRARRLLPASLTCVLAVSLMAWAGWFRGVANLRRDVVGAVFQVFNWVKLASGESYADLTAAQAGLKRPLDHYWSLAIEEQFYWVWPLVFVTLLAVARRRRVSPLTLVAALAVLAGVAAPVIAHVWGANAVYWATPARASEILSGAAVACWLHSRSASARELPRHVAILAPLGLATLAAACVLFPDGHGPAYRGALPLVGAASAALILGLQAGGPVRQLLGGRPLVALGRISYGVYLYHWPIFVLVDRASWAVPVTVVLAIKFALTLAVAAASYLFIERPARRARWVTPRFALRAALASSVVVAMVAVAVVPTSSTYYAIDATAAQAVAIDAGPVAPLVPLMPVVAHATGGQSRSFTAAEPAPTGSTPTTEPVLPPRPVRIMVVGDSTAEATGAGIVAWAVKHPALAQVTVAAGPGCGLVLGGYLELATGQRDVDAECGPYVYGIIPAKVVELHPDVVMVLSTLWDAQDRRLTKDGPLLPPTNAAVEAAITKSLAGFTDALLASGVPRVVWVESPPPLPSLTGGDDQQSQPARHSVLRHVVATIAFSRPAVRIVDLAAWVKAQPLGRDRGARPDGVHWTGEASLQIANGFLGAALVRAALS